VAEEESKEGKERPHRRDKGIHIPPRFTSRRFTLFRYGGVIIAQAERPSDKPAKKCWIAGRKPTKQESKRLLIVA
jgi:hypothetical protein